MTASFPMLAPTIAGAGEGRKILLLSTNLMTHGGAEVQVMQLAAALHRRGWNAVLVSMLPPGELSAEVRAARIPVYSLSMKRGVPDPRAVLRLKKIIDLFQPDLVHSHMTHANLLARAVRPLTRVPVLICTLHGLHMNAVRRGSPRMREIAHRITDRWADLTTTVCRAAAEQCILNGSVPQGKVLPLPNFVDTGLYRPDPETRARLRSMLALDGRFVWLAAGRLEAVKDYSTMIDAFASVCAGQRRATLLICGNGSLTDAIRRQIAARTLNESVRLMGVRQDIPELMAAADAYVMSSRSEGLPMALLQASAASLPIVATDVGGNSEVVEDGETGYLVRPADPDALGSAMLRLMALPDVDRWAMGAAGRARTNSLFSQDRVASRWEELYTRLLTAKAADPVLKFKAAQYHR
ncbi:MAG TPA: glycosyltransferase [Bryobacteraceae bacterium]|jgi:glycosyltransferase involved in cell wall biosynthesis|nr:glycosyltransferase [Bryobacteraceae bacterium]